jgi:hypothetical protein
MGFENRKSLGTVQACHDRKRRAPDRELSDETNRDDLSGNGSLYVQRVLCVRASPHRLFYDQCKKLPSRGSVQSAQWENPHVLIVVKMDDGTTLFEKGRPQIMALDASDFVGEARFNHKRVIFRFLVSPCFECAAESMPGQFFVALHPLQRLEHCDIR